MLIRQLRQATVLLRGMATHLILPSYSSPQVAIPMRFNGKSGVEVRLPNDLEDLKGYTSLSLFLQRPDLRENGGTEDMFVMYLGNKDVRIMRRFTYFTNKMVWGGATSRLVI